MTTKLNMLMLPSLAVAGLLFAGTAYAQGQEPQGRGGMMMAQQRQMMADMQAAQTKLDALVVSMNAANGAEKVDRLAAVVTEMVAQHKAMSQRMMSMQSGMMQEMMQRMHAAPAGTAASPNDGSAEDHGEHHPAQK